MSSINTANPENFKQLEEQQAEVIKGEINAILQKTQTLGTDVFKFGLEYHRKFPKEYPALEENWVEEFKNMAVYIEIKAKLIEVGLSAAPLKPKEE